MEEQGGVYTLGSWLVKPGQEQAFIQAWKELGAEFARLAHPPSGAGRLVQSMEDPLQFCSFGPWRSVEDVQEMRGNPGAVEAIGRLLALCTVGKPGMFRLVATAGG